MNGTAIASTNEPQTSRYNQRSAPIATGKDWQQLSGLRKLVEAATTRLGKGINSAAAPQRLRQGATSSNSGEGLREEEGDEGETEERRQKREGRRR
ncbi:hypothetical protein CDL15_Pgr027114 [Punica granatum]|uniref:Uncharacterized protein n=1 Tax=Punica granatum TaxID=22663 RepID=A0A218XHE5_PUNGR|nr:hypothetical protein CDL15_Pgr027114 [Punica granatum]